MDIRGRIKSNRWLVGAVIVLSAVLIISLALLLSGILRDEINPFNISRPSISPTSTSSGRKKLIVGGDEAYPPYSYLENGVAMGFDNDLVRAVADGMDMDVEFRLGPWVQVKQQLLNGEIDLVNGMAYSAARDEVYDFANAHSLHYSDVFIRKNSKIHNLADIEGKEVIVQSGDIMQDYLQEIKFTGRVISVDNPEQALKLLSSGKHDAALLNSLIGYYYIKQNRYNNLRALNLHLVEREYGFAVQEENDDLLNRLNLALAVVDTTGEYEQLNQKWFSLYQRQAVIDQIRLFLYGFIGLVALFGLVVLWVWTLAGRVKTTTKALSISEQKYARLINSATEGVIVIKGFNIVYINPQAKNILEVDEELTLPIPYTTFLLPEDKESIKKILRSDGRGGAEQLQTNLHVRTRQRNLRWIKLKTVPIDWEEKPAILGMFADITEPRQMEEALRESEGKYRLLFNKSPVGLFYYDLNLQITNCNDRMQEIFGLSRQEIEGYDFHTLPETDKGILPAVNAVLRKEDGFYKGLCTLYPSKYRSDLYISLHTTPIFNEQKQLTGGIGLIEDITDEELNIHKLQNLEVRFAKAFLTSPDSININRLKDGLFLDVNDGFLEMTGYTREEVVGKSSLELDIWENPQDRQKLVTDLHKNGLVKSMEAPFRMKDGRLLIGSISASLLDVDGEPCIISIARDISEEKASREALRAGEYRYRSIFESVPVSIWEQDFQAIYDALQVLRNAGVGDLKEYLADHPELTRKLVKSVIVKDVNQASLRMYEAQSKEELEISLDKIFPPEAFTNFEQELCAIWEHKKIFEGETVNWTLDGKKMLVSLQVYLPEKREDFSSVLVSIADITHRKQSEAALRESEARYRSIFNTVPVSIWEEDFSAVINFLEDLRDHGVQDLDLHFRQNPASLREALSMVVIKEVNDITVTMYSAKNKQDLLRSLSTVFTEDAYDNFRRELLAFWNKQSFYISETTNRTLDGRVLKVLLSTTIPRDIKDYSRVLVSVEDITERKNAEEKIKRQVEHLAALRAVDLAISASMELSQTLRVLINQARQQLGVDAASILLLNPEKGILDYSAGSGFRTLAVENTHLKLGESYAGRAALEKRIVASSDLDSHHSQLTTIDFNQEHFTDYIGIPLIAKGVVKGVLELFNRSPLSADSDWMGFLESMSSQAAIAIDNATLFDEVQQANQNLRKAYDDTIVGWAHALELRDGDTEWHSVRVAEMAVTLAELVGVNSDELVDIRRGALLHDIGKMGIPDEILLKSSALTEKEWAIMRKHPVYSRDLLSSIDFLKKAIEIPYTHHEKWDGSGYPEGLKGEEIPLSGRIFAVVDCWDALRSNRPYRKAISDQETWEYIRSNSGKAYDPAVVEKFRMLIGPTEPNAVD